MSPQQARKQILDLADVNYVIYQLKKTQSSHSSIHVIY